MKIHRKADKDGKTYAETNLNFTFSNLKDAIKTENKFDLALISPCKFRRGRILQISVGQFIDPSFSDQEVANIIDNKIKNILSTVNTISKDYSVYKYDVTHLEFESDYKNL